MLYITVKQTDKGIEMNLYRIENKQNAIVNDEAVTLFDIYTDAERINVLVGKTWRTGFVFSGRRSAIGHNASDDVCVSTTEKEWAEAENWLND